MRRTTRERPAPGRASPSRRVVLLGGLGVVAAGGAAAYELVQDGTLPGKYALARLTGACGSPPPPPHGEQPARQVTTFDSVFRRRRVTMVTLAPPGVPGVAGLGVVIALHGAGADALSLARQVGPAMTAAGIRQFVTVAVDGADTYWHSRADGDDPTGMIICEVLPRLAAAGLSTRRIGIAGQSMGGYGALLLAEQLAQPRLLPAAVLASRVPLPKPAAVAALSPAVFASYPAARAANRSAFDSQADFDRNNVVTGIAALRAVPALVSCGADDPFEAEAAVLRERLAGVTGRQPAGGILPGCHDGAFWDRNLPAALRFLGSHLR